MGLSAGSSALFRAVDVDNRGVVAQQGDGSMGFVPTLSV